MSLQLPLVVRRCVSFFFSPQLRGEFAVTCVPLSKKGNFNDIAHQSYIGVFSVFGDPKQPVKTMAWTMGRQSGQPRHGI